MNVALRFFLGILGLAAANVSAGPAGTGRLARVFVSNDFESGTMSPWFDQSPARVNWRVEDVQSPAEINSPVPSPPAGSKYLRATRNVDLSSGLAVLKSPVFTALPGDRVGFSFWIRSKQAQANNLELYYTKGNEENLLIGLSDFSSPTNFEWRNISVDLPFTSSTDISLIFYGFCGNNPEDAIGLDDIVVASVQSTTEPPTTTATPVPTTSPPDCNAVLNSPSGSFNSPNYPDNYGNNLNCNWLIVTSSDTRISLTFPSFNTELSADVVRVYNGASTTAPLLATFSGTVTTTTESSDNVMLVTFTTDSSVTYGGFWADYISFEATTPSTTPSTTTTTTEVITTTEYPVCQDSYVYDSGYISSPNYPDDYPNNSNCFWYLDARGLGIYLRFDVFSTESGYDFVQVYEGWSTSGTLLLSASGHSVPGAVHTSQTSRLLVHFRSNAANSAGGFRAYFDEYYETTTAEPETTTTATTTTVATTTDVAPTAPNRCDQTLTGNSGELTSPYYPYEYPNNLICNVVIRVSSGNRIRVDFTEFDTEPNYDIVTIFNGATTSSPGLLRASGSALPAPVTSSYNEILVQFTTDGSGNSFKGWRFTYSVA